MVSRPSLNDFTGRTEGERYHSESETVNMPDDVADPHTWKDESAARRREWLARNKRMIVTVSFLGLVVFAILMIYFSRFIPQLFANTYVRVFVGGGLFTATIFLAGARHQRNKLQRVDWLILIYPEGVQRYLGYYSETEDGAPMFIPVKGFTFFGSRSSKFTLGDMSNEMARQFSKGNRKADDPAKIRLHPSMCAVAQTDMGTVVAQLTGELTPDEFGRETDIEATVPELADKDRMADVKEEIEKQVAHNAFLKDQVDMLEQQRDDYKQVAMDTLDEAEERIVGLVGRIEGARNGVVGGGGGMSGGMGSGMGGPEPDYGDYNDELEEEFDEP